MHNPRMTVGLNAFPDKLSCAHPRYRLAKYIKRVYSTDIRRDHGPRVSFVSFSHLLSTRHNTVLSGRPQFAVIIMFIFLIHLSPHTNFDDPVPRVRCSARQHRNVGVNGRYRVFFYM